MQREVPTIPLMLVDGYRADGWLGMLIGTRMWYGFFGSVLSDDALFDGKVSELCRDLGERGRQGQTTEGDFIGEVDEGRGQLLFQPADLTIKDLRAKARAAGATADQLESASDADDMRQALVAILLQQAPEAKHTSEELATLSNKELRARAKHSGATAEQLEAASDADDMREALVAIVLRVARV